MRHYNTGGNVLNIVGEATNVTTSWVPVASALLGLLLHEHTPIKQKASHKSILRTFQLPTNNRCNARALSYSLRWTVYLPWLVRLYSLAFAVQSVHNATVNAPLMLLSVVKLLILLPYCYGAVHYSAFRLLSVCQLKSVGLPQSAEPNSQLTGRLQFSSLWTWEPCGRASK